jgi:nitrate reductase alpha subunit
MSRVFHVSDNSEVVFTPIALHTHGVNRASSCQDRVIVSNLVVTLDK